ncbi:hypothetical protein EMGR_002866, partial [Emarellia grisea]
TYHRRTLAENTFVMGTYARGNASRRDSIHFAQPVRDAEGRTTGVLAAAVDLDWLDKYLRRNLRLPSTSVTVADADKTILVRYPDGNGWVGKQIPPERQRFLVDRGEGVRVDLGIDGRERVLANTRPMGVASEAWVVVGRDRVVAFADVDAATRRGVVLI